MDSLDNVSFPSPQQRWQTLLTGDRAISATEHRSTVWRTPCFINFSPLAFSDGSAECLPQDKVVIEILKMLSLDDALLDKADPAARLGYRLAPLMIRSRPWEQVLPTIHIIKFDICGPRRLPVLSGS